LPPTAVKRPSLTRCDATKFPTIIAHCTQHPAPDIAPRTSHHLCSSLHACTLALMRTIDAKKSATMVVAPNKREARNNGTFGSLWTEQTVWADLGGAGFEF